MKWEGMLIKNPFPKACVPGNVLGTVRCHYRRGQRRSGFSSSGSCSSRRSKKRGRWTTGWAGSRRDETHSM